MSLWEEEEWLMWILEPQVRNCSSAGRRSAVGRGQFMLKISEIRLAQKVRSSFSIHPCERCNLCGDSVRPF